MMARALYIARLAGRGLYGRYALSQMQVVGGVGGSSSTESKSVIRYASGAAGRHWKYEKLVTVGLLALIPAAGFYPCAVVDYGLAVTIPLHGHWGLLSVVDDYSSDIMKKALYVLVYAVSLGTFAGLMYLNYSDIGICQAVKMIWSK